MSNGMSDAEILLAIEKVVREHIKADAKLEPRTLLKSALELDSLKQLTLIVELENYFDVDLEDSEAYELETVADVVKLIQKQHQQNTE